MTKILSVEVNSNDLSFIRSTLSRAIYYLPQHIPQCSFFSSKKSCTTYYHTYTLNIQIIYAKHKHQHLNQQHNEHSISMMRTNVSTYDIHFSPLTIRSLSIIFYILWCIYNTILHTPWGKLIWSRSIYTSDHQVKHSSQARQV